MATQVTFVPGATTTNVSLPTWAPDIASMPTTTVAGWAILYDLVAGTTASKPGQTRADSYTARTFKLNATSVAGPSDRGITVIYNAVGEFCRAT